MGLSSSYDECNRRGDLAVEGLTGLTKIVDDILVFSNTLEGHWVAVRAFLKRCREFGISLNRAKTRLALGEVKFAGFVLSGEGVKADPVKLKALHSFPQPTNLTDLRSFPGLVEQLAGFSKDMTEALLPLQPLLSVKNLFVWTADHSRAFEAVKAALVSPLILSTFDVTRATRLETDAARTKGLGYALRQQDDAGRWVLIDAESRFISETEGRYAMVELELLAATWAVAKCRNYLLGLKHFELWVDHQPLKSILDRQTLDCVENPRLQRLKVRLAPYAFTTVWVKGKDHSVADALSRNPASDPTADDLEEERDLYGSVAMVIATALRAVACAELISKDMIEGHVSAQVLMVTSGHIDVPGDTLLADLRQVGRDDARYCEILSAVQQGGALPKDLEKAKDHLWVQDGLLLHGLRIVLPEGARREILARLHAAHLGAEQMLRLARQMVF